MGRNEDFSSTCCWREESSRQRNKGWFLRPSGSVSWSGSAAQVASDLCVGASSPILLFFLGGGVALHERLVGTLYFNFSTFNAMRMNLSVTKIDRLVWSADFLGSVLFLVSSSLAYGEVASALTSPKLKSLTWWVVLSNLLGSVAFGISAITSFILPSVGTMINANVTNLFTAIGGVCFFVGALLQLLETNRENAKESKNTSGDSGIAAQGASQVIEGQA